MNLKIQHKILLLLSFMSLLLIITGTLGYLGMKSIEGNFRLVYAEHVSALSDLKNLSDLYAVDIVDTAHKVQFGNITWNDGLRKITKAQQNSQKILDTIKNTQLYTEEVSLVEEIGQLITSVNKDIVILTDIISKQDKDALRAYRYTTLYKTIDPLTLKLEELTQLQLKLIKAEYEESVTAFNRSKFVLLFGIIAVLLIAIYGTIKMLRKITQPLSDKLTETEERLSAAFEFSTLGQAITSPEKGWLEVNSALCSIFGYTKEELVKLTWAEMTHPDDLDADVKQFNLVLSGVKDGYSMDKRFICKDGSIVYTTLWVHCKRKKDGAVDYLIALIQDITERKRLEDAIRIEIELVKKREKEIRILEERLALAIEGSELGAWDWDIQTGDVIMSPYWKKMLGYEVHELDNKISAVMDLMYLEDKEKVSQLLEKYFAGETDKFVSEIRYRHKDGSYRCILAQGKVFDWTNDGKPLRMMGTNSDITQRKQMEDELKRLNINLESAVVEETQKRRLNEQMLIQQSKMAAMGEMIGLIAHQWKQPINAIGLNVQDLEDCYKYGEVDDKYIGNLVVSTMWQIDFMAKTMDDFRNFFKPSKKKVSFDVKAAIEELLSMFINVFSKSDIDVSVKTSIDTLSHTDGYLSEFKQVVLNISNNSKDAIVSRKKITPELQGRIEINIANNDDKSKILISIKDNGGGIADDVINKIFEPYFTTKETEGTGIGLYMSKTIIETNMGGSLTVHNVDGGAEFVISLDVSGDTVGDR
ncbi:PAS domain S-box protein [Candidatus Magnetomonas plexicatena]|uniref:PAS domain S-box protein n=1 Tax=Candidatus Magnetomonas plexicatena TaxID=2552947 RepID=UPI001C7676BC|nr:PAS domain S-box protein [Nitrospirales bacterium LBB_01]